MKDEITDPELIYKLMHPKPALLVTSVNHEGKANVMACAWATPVSMEPLLVLICVAKGHYTSELILRSREFVINIPSKELLKTVWIAGQKSGRDTDKISLTGIHLTPGKKVDTPSIDECIGHLECELVASLDGGECNIFVGEVVHASADGETFSQTWGQDSSVLLHLGGEWFTIPGEVLKAEQ